MKLNPSIQLNHTMSLINNQGMVAFSRLFKAYTGKTFIAHFAKSTNEESMGKKEQFPNKRKRTLKAPSSRNIYCLPVIYPVNQDCCFGSGSGSKRIYTCARSIHYTVSDQSGYTLYCIRSNDFPISKLIQV